MFPTSKNHPLCDTRWSPWLCGELIFETNLASACAEHGQIVPAAKYYARALELDPDYEVALRNFAKVCIETQRWHDALGLCRQLRKKVPGDPEFNWLVIDCLKNLGDVDWAIAELHALAERTPQDDRVFRELGMLYLNEKRDLQAAARNLARSLELNPNQPDLAILLGKPPAAENPTPELPQLPGIEPPIPQPPDVNVSAPLPQLPKPFQPGLPTPQPSA